MSELDLADAATSTTLAERLALSDQVALRPEPFGALAYHYGTRRLVFLRDHALVAVVNALGHHPSAASACDALGVAPTRRASFARALDGLRAAGVVVGVDTSERAADGTATAGQALRADVAATRSSP